MVATLVALVPILAGAGILTLGLAGSIHPDAPGSPIPIIYLVVLAALVLVAAIVVRRNHEHPRNLHWVLLVLGVVLFSAGEVAELFLGTHELLWEDVLRLAAYLPIAFFTLGVTRPLGLVVRRRSRLALTVGASLLLAVVALVDVLPYLLPRLDGRSVEFREVLMAARPILDAVLLVPLLAVAVTAGVRAASGPYLLVAAGLLFLTLSDVFFHYDYISEQQDIEVAAFACGVAALVYFLLAFARRRVAVRPRGSERV